MGVSLAEVDLIATIHVLVRMHKYLAGLTAQCSGGWGVFNKKMAAILDGPLKGPSRITAISDFLNYNLFCRQL